MGLAERKCRLEEPAEVHDGLHATPAKTERDDSAAQVLGEPTLKTTARELTESVRRNVTTDWTVRENVRAQLRV
jgi:hypothetical protein